MQRWVNGILMAALAACLFGCSATGPRFSEMAQSMPSLGEDEGRIYFFRNSILGMAVQPDVTVNGQVVGTSQPNSFFYIDRPSGLYRASARTEVEGTIDISLRPKQTAYVQMSIGMGFLVGHPVFERVAEAEGRKELPSLAFGGVLPTTAAKATVSTSASATAATRAGAPSSSPPTQPAALATPVASLPTVVAVQPARQAEPMPTLEPKATLPALPARNPTPVLASRATSTSSTDATPFAKTTLNDLRLLMQTNR